MSAYRVIGPSLSSQPRQQGHGARLLGVLAASTSNEIELGQRIFDCTGFHEQDTTTLAARSQVTLSVVLRPRDTVSAESPTLTAGTSGAKPWVPLVGL